MYREVHHLSCVIIIEALFHCSTMPLSHFDHTLLPGVIKYRSLHHGGWCVGWREDILETAWLLSLRHTLKDLLISPLSLEPHGCDIARARVQLLNVHFHTLWQLVAGARATDELGDGTVAEVAPVGV